MPAHVENVTAALLNLLYVMMAALGKPVVPEVYISIAMSGNFAPARRESGGLSGLLSAIVLLGTISAQDKSGIVSEGESESRIQIVRIPAAERSSFIVWTFVAISESKMKSFESAAVMQWRRGFDVRL